MPDSTTHATDAATFRAQFPVFDTALLPQRRHRGPRPGARRRGRPPPSRPGGAPRPRRPTVLRGLDGAARQGPGGLRARDRGPACGRRADRLDDRRNQHRDRRASTSAPATRSSPPTRSTPGCWRRSGGRAGGHGISVRIVPFAEIADAVTPATKLIACSHVSWVGGRIVDAAGAVGDRRAGAARRRAGDRRGPGRRRGARRRLLRRLRPEVAVRSRRAAAACTCVEGRLEELLVPWPGYASLADPMKALDFEQAEGVGAARSRLSERDAQRLGGGVVRACSSRPAGTGCTSARRRLAARRWPSSLAERGLEVLPRGRSTLVSWKSDDPEAEVARLAERGRDRPLASRRSAWCGRRSARGRPRRSSTGWSISSLPADPRRSVARRIRSGWV